MIKLIRGFKDILPDETGLWQHMERTARQVFADFGYDEIRIPLLERTELFARTIGTGTDIVEKEMYTFTDRNGSSLTLRPEATASVVRAYLEHKLYAKDPVWKLYTIGPMFRRERPQKGRYRQFHQINAEVFGLQDPRTDAELILLLMTFFDRLALSGIELNLNCLGCRECRPDFAQALAGFLENRSEGLCSDCLRRQGQNPLRVFDCKVPGCREIMVEAPSVLDHLCPNCQAHFDALREALEAFQISYRTNHRLVRGLDYYTRTTFEVLAGALGAQDAVAGGGRYDGLVQALGGPDQPGIGFAVGADRLRELLLAQQAPVRRGPRLFIAALGQTAQAKAFLWVQQLRMLGLRTEMDLQDRSLKAQMRRANKLEAAFVLIVGEQEMDDGQGVLRDLATREQERIPLADVITRVAGRIKDHGAGP